VAEVDVEGCSEDAQLLALAVGASALCDLGVPATSASANRLFCIAGRAYDELRQKMKEARVNREKRHAKRSSWDIDGLGRISGERGGDEEVRVGGNGHSDHDPVN
jgi:hypothetical protein